MRGVRHGVGKLSFSDGMFVLWTIFIHLLICIHSSIHLLVYPSISGSFYRGDFQSDQMYGKGIFVGADSTQYDGDWKANMRQGMGTAIDSDGRYI